MDVKAKVFNANVFFWKYITVLSLLFLSAFFFNPFFPTVILKLLKILSLSLFGVHCNWWWWWSRCCAGCLREVWVSTSLREQQSRSIKVFTFTLTLTFTFTWKSNKVRDDMKNMVRSCSCLRFGIGLIISLKVFMVGRDVQLKHIIVRTQ